MLTRSVTAWLMVRSAVSCSPRPRLKFRLAEQPSPSMSASAVVTMVSGKATLVAAMPVMPTPCPTKIWSAIL